MSLLLPAITSAQSSAQLSTATKTLEERRLSAHTAVRLRDGEKLTLDGKLDDAIWQRTAPIKEFLEYRPRDGVEAKFKSEARIAYDHQALYIGLTAFDPHPSQIDAPFVRRDEVQGSQDFFAVHIDPIGTRKFAQIYRVSASGVIGDGLYSEDSGNEDYAPDFEWQAEVKRTDFGWTVEMRIPFSSLRYSSPPSELWSIQVIRALARDQVYRFANAHIPRDSNSFMAYAQTLAGMKDLPNGREFTLTPQVTWRNTSDRINGSGIRGNNDFVAGADVKFRPRPDLVFDATINPDFSQVELDTPQLAANAQFALFFLEKRPFFLEGADILSTPINAIYTRSINDPAWGTRLTQRKDGTDFVFLTARDDGKGFILLPRSLGTGFAQQDSKSQATIARFRMNVDGVTLGALLTDRTYDKKDNKPALTNRVGGVDAVWRPTGELRLRAQVLGSDTCDERNKDQIARNTPYRDVAALADYNYRSAKWGIFGGVQRFGRGFRADNGFISQAGYKNVYQEFQRKWTDIGSFNEISPFLNLSQKRDLDGRLLYQQNHLGVFFGLPRSTGVVVEWRPRDLVRARETGAPLKRDQFFMNIESNPGKIITYMYAEFLSGERFDVSNNRITDGYFFNANATIRLSDRWELEPRIENSVLDNKRTAPGSNRILLERAVQLKAVYHFSSRDTLRFIGQYNAVRRAPSLFESSVSPFEKTETVSLVYGHRRGLGTKFYVGATASRTLDPGAKFTRKQSEIFAQWSWAFDLSELL
jgi:hypothetical protein